MRLVVFDDRGQAWDPRSPTLATHLGSVIAGESLVDYTVRNMGYVSAVASAASAHVRLRPATVAPAALGTLLTWLQVRPLERVLLSAFEDEWRHELMPSHNAMSRLTAVAVSRRAA